MLFPLSSAGPWTVLSTVLLSLCEGFVAKIIGQSQPNTYCMSLIGSEAAALPFWVTCYNDDKCPTNHWVTMKSTQIALSSFPSIAFYDTHVKPPLLGLSTGPATMLQTRRLCLASWQISEALAYPKSALTHMWRQHCVRWALLHDPQQRLKSTDDPGTPDLFWQNQEIPLMLREINHFHSL